MRMVRFRMGNKIEERRYWEEKEKKLCRLCAGEVETWEHVWKSCRDWKEGGGTWQETVNWILGENGEGERWMREWEWEMEQWKLLCTLCDKYYPILKVWGLFEFTVSIRHPDDLEKILSSTKHIDKSRTYNILHPWFGTGLLTSTGIKWQTRPKILTPAFHFNILNQFVDILIKQSDCMTKSLKDVGRTVVKDLLPFISEYTLNAICETAMGVSLQKLGEFQQQYRNAIHEIIELILYRAIRPWLLNDFLFSLSSQGSRQKEVLKILHGFTEKVIAERKLYDERTGNRYLQNLEDDKETEAEDIEVFGIKKKRLAMLDLLIAASRESSLTDLDIREEVDTFNGHDTTAVGIMFALLLLAEHKDIQERVRVEVNTVMQENGGKLTMKSLQNLSYLDRCLREALRLYPSVFIISRNTAEDVKLRQRFGLLELKAMIAPLVHNFYLEPIEDLKDIQLKTDIILRPSHPVHVRFIPITCK
ncbi:Cytochrome P450 4C1 [Camponotus floridanus]|uniref:Cytochrome P450 4C1 n=1 Tax=Camponotus floridanus TaxID=104421 RepID=E2A182_CAMFO|nr:Cytochrome P450 4C1 [Camponotus floridanus]